MFRRYWCLRRQLRDSPGMVRTSHVITCPVTYWETTPTNHLSVPAACWKLPLSGVWSSSTAIDLTIARRVLEHRRTPHVKLRRRGVTSGHQRIVESPAINSVLRTPSVQFFRCSFGTRKVIRTPAHPGTRGTATRFNLSECV